MVQRKIEKRVGREKRASSGSRVCKLRDYGANVNYTF